MEYNIQLTEEFLGEFEEISDYISKKLKAIEASNRLRAKVMYSILLLEKSPKMFEEIEKINKTERQYRRIVVYIHDLL